MRFPSFLLMSLLVVLGCEKNTGGYESARWGMSRERIEKLFPNGLVKPGSDGKETRYYAWKTVGTRETKADFIFGDDRLESVCLRFLPDPKPDNLNTVSYLMPFDRAQRTYLEVANALDVKYGKHEDIASAVGGPVNSRWTTEEGRTIITFVLIPRPISEAMVVLCYWDAGKFKEKLTKGL